MSSLSIVNVRSAQAYAAPRASNRIAALGLAYERKIKKQLNANGAIDAKEINPKDLNKYLTYFFHNPWFEYQTNTDIETDKKIWRRCALDYLLFIPKLDLNLNQIRVAEKTLAEKTVSLKNKSLKNLVAENLVTEKNNPAEKITSAEKAVAENITAEKAIAENLAPFEIIILEVKLSFKDSAFNKLQNLYKPVTEKYFQRNDVKTLQVCKYLNPSSPVAENSIRAALNLSPSLMQWLGHGKFRIF